MESVSYEDVAMLEEILTTTADHLAHETFLVRHRQLTGAALAQTLIFGWLQEPDITLDGLTQVLGRCAIAISASGLNQRFTAATVTFFERVLHELVQAHLQQHQPVPIPILRQFSAVFVEDSSPLPLPDELADVALGCGGVHGTSRAGLKVMVQWNLSTGELWGPICHEARCADLSAAIPIEELPADCLYLADLGFWQLERLAAFCGGHGQPRRFFVSRYKTGTVLWSHGGHRLVLAGILPQQVGQVLDQGVLLGKEAKIPVRLVAERVPPEVAEQRRERLRRESQSHGSQPSEESLSLANWTIVITNVPCQRLSTEQILVILHVRWQIECLFHDWKSHAGLTHWRSKKPWRILCEIYAKLCAVVIQQWLISLGCWSDPARSQTKAAQVVRREAGRLMVALGEGNLAEVITAVLGCMRSGCRTNTRRSWPSLAQYLFGEPLDRRPRPIAPPNLRRVKRKQWAAGKGWAHD